MLTAYFVNWEGGSTLRWNFIRISFHVPENESPKSLQFESEIFDQKMGVRLARSIVVTMATMHLLTVI